ncbi:ArsR family transcriptional regulator [Enterococcus sp.]|uniref:ArsR family transcriptional regulator n=1 Tax=Enterococcus sp. TaxID=35783 RepID=UPI00289D6065|nr:ArsR family transcriptional regulator [Enterococcus sp.]
MISEREKAIIRYLLENGPTTVAKIGLHMSLSQKTVSQSLKRIDEFLQETAIRLVRKPRVGVFLDGDSAEILKYLDGNEESNLPTSKKIVFSFFALKY